MKLLVLDGNSIVNRAFYGLKMLTTHDGHYTNAIFGFLNIMFSLSDTVSPDSVAIAFDVKQPTFRHEMYDLYKSNRHGMPDELAEQMPRLKQLLRAMGYPILECPGFEADDILGTLALNCRDTDECYIATGDRDSLQLVSDRVTVLLAAPKQGRTETIAYTPEKVLMDKGVLPKKLIDVKALMGDQSDCIPGVKGIGEKTATSLIEHFESIDYIYDNIDTIDVTETVRNKLKAGKDDAFLSRTLGTIVSNAPVSTDYSSFAKHEMDKQETKRILTELEMFKFIDKLGLKDVVVVSTEAKEVKSERFDGSDEDFLALVRKVGKAGFVFDKEFTECSISCLGKVKTIDIDTAKALLSDKAIAKVTADCKSMFEWAKSVDLEIESARFDILLAGYLLCPSSSDYSVKSIADLYKVTTELESDSETEKSAALIEPLADKLTEVLTDFDEMKLLTDVEIPLAEVLADMENTGFKVDYIGIYEFGKTIENRIGILYEAIIGYAGHDFNINSPKQLGTVLFEELGLPVKKKTKNGYSTNADVLESLRGAHPIIDDILEYRTLSKLKSTYCDGLMKVVDNKSRIHSTFKQTETRTGRLSSAEPNLQNIPVKTELGSEMRKFFTCDEGNVLVDADYSQIELRVLSCIANDERMINAFNEKKDIHSTTASEVFGIPLEMVTPLMRTRAKAVNFGIVYGIGAYSLSRDIGVTVKEAKNYIENYLKTYSGVDGYMKRVVAEAKEDGFVKTYFGRRRYLPELTSSNAIQRAFGERVARNMPIQGTAADIIKIAMVGVYKRLKNENMRSKLIMQVHDELIIEAPEDERDKAMRILEEEMTNAVNWSVRFDVDVHSGKTWYEAKG